MKLTLVFCINAFFAIGSALHPSLAVDTGTDLTPQPSLSSSSFPPLYAIMPQADLLKDFEPMQLIGLGGDSRVWKVKDRKTNHTYALVIKNEMNLRLSVDYKKNLVERLLKNQEYNPHITPIYAHFWILNPNFPVSSGEKKGVLVWENIKPGRVLNDTWANDPDATPYRHEAALIELGLGDLDSEGFANLDMDKTIINLMAAFNSMSLNLYKILPTNDKPQNYIYVKTENQTYKGQKMSNFDVWRYFGQFYIPKQPYIIKRIDYATWDAKDLGDVSEPCPMWTKQEIAIYCGITEEQLDAFCVPPPEGTPILDITMQ